MTISPLYYLLIARQRVMQKLDHVHSSPHFYPCMGLSVVVVVGTKIVRSHVLGICTYCLHNQSVDIGEKLVCTCFELLKKAY